MSEVIIGSGGATASEEVSTMSTPPNRVVIQSEAPKEPAQAVQKTEESQPKPGTEQAQDKPAVESTTENPATDEQSQTDEAEGFIVGDFDMTALSDEFQRDGKLSEASYAELAENGFSRELVDTYIRGVQAQAADAGELAKEHVDAIITEVGGLEKYEAVLKWADGKLSKEEKDAYNKAVTGKDPTVARLVVQGLVSRYEREYGHVPTLVKGSKVQTSSMNEGFPDRSSMIQAMKDPRYGNDPEYTRTVEAKVLRSGLMRSGRRRV